MKDIFSTHKVDIWEPDPDREADDTGAVDTAGRKRTFKNITCGIVELLGPEKTMQGIFVDEDAATLYIKTARNRQITGKIRYSKQAIIVDVTDPSEVFYWSAREKSKFFQTTGHCEGGLAEVQGGAPGDVTDAY